MAKAASAPTRWLAVALVALCAAACGGDAPTAATPAPTPTPTPTPTPLPTSGEVVVLGSDNFAPMVIGSGWTCLVEFQRPT
jgi:hypothetical protein